VTAAMEGMIDWNSSLFSRCRSRRGSPFGPCRWGADGTVEKL